MLAKPDQYNILWVIFLREDDYVILTYIARIIFLCNVVLIAPEENYTCKNHIQCCAWGSRQHCTGKIPGNVVWTSGHSVYILGPPLIMDMSQQVR